MICPDSNRTLPQHCIRVGVQAVVRGCWLYVICNNFDIVMRLIMYDLHSPYTVRLSVRGMYGKQVDLYLNYADYYHF